MPITVLRKRLRVKRYLYYGIVLLFLLPVQAQQGENASQQERAKAQNRISPQPSAAQSTAENPNIQKPESPIEQAKGTDQERGNRDSVTRAEKIQIGINAVMFLVVLAQTVIYIQQRNIMQKQIELARISE